MRKQAERKLLLLRATADEDYADLATLLNVFDGDTSTLGDFGNIPTSDILPVPEGVVGATFYFAGGQTANDTFGACVMGCADVNGPQQIICTVSGVIGTFALNTYPHDKSTATSRFWADTLTVTGNWVTSVSTQTGALNYIDTLTFDPLYLKYLWCYIYGADGANSAGECDDVTVYVVWTFSENYVKSD